MKLKKWGKSLWLMGVTLCLLLTASGRVLAMSSTERDEILKYATMWFGSYNSEYNNYASDPNKHEDSNFVSQALQAAGQMFSGPSPSMDEHECIFDRDILEIEVKTFLGTDRFDIEDLGDVPASIATGDVIFFMGNDSQDAAFTGVILVSDSEKEDSSSNITVAYHADTTGGSVGDIKYLSEMLLIYGKARLYHFKSD